jgi:BirA family biotin operon repressor/biotin-[acetyl-CoA-carboxylase] ligase
MYIKQTYSTSTLLRELYSEQLPHLYTIRTDFQTAGRGQAGNTWESEEGKNLLFSALLRYDNIRATEQWRLSMLVPLALWDVLAKYLPADRLTIKWPNDIYYDNQKLVGILIENALAGQYIGHSIAGIGLNINQVQWISNAPNPISMKQITGQEYEPEALMNEWIAAMQQWEDCSTEQLYQAYYQHLYRREGWHKYVEREVSLTPTAIAPEGIEGEFIATIAGITPQGELILRKENNEEKTYHFKQIRFVL